MSKPQPAFIPIRKRGGGRKPIPGWGRDVPAELDRVTKWSGDVKRMIDRLNDLHDALWAMDYNLRHSEETKDLLEGALTVSSQVFNKAGMIFRALYRAHGRA